MSSIRSENQSRFGFHPCNRELFEKLKYLHRRYWETLYRFHLWHRWNNKEPQNRVGAEPEYCPAFILKQPWRKPVTRNGEQHYKWYPRTVVDHNIVKSFQDARVPSPGPVAPLDPGRVQQIERLFQEVKEYFRE